MCVCMFSHSDMSDSVTLWTVACQASLSMEFSGQGFRSRLLFPPQGNLPDPGIEPTSLEPPSLAGEFFTTVPPGYMCRLFFK